MGTRLLAGSAAVLLAIVCAVTASAGAAPPRGDGVPILMYHLIDDPPADAPFPELWVDARTFRAQVAWLARHGFHAVTLSDVLDHWEHGKRLPSRPIVLTFDDGYRSVAEAASPVLRARGWPAVVNMKAAFLDLPWGLRPRQLRPLIAAGWEIGAHTITHPDLTAVGAAQLRREVAGSKEILSQRLHTRVDVFCYPAGRYDGTVLAAVRRAGYRAATTTEHGLGVSSQLYTLDRIRVNRSDGVAGLAAKLRGLGVVR